MEIIIIIIIIIIINDVVNYMYNCIDSSGVG